MMIARISLLLLSFSLLPIQAAERQTVGVPKLEDDTGAGEGPSWDPDGYLYFSGGGKIHRRSQLGKTEVFRDQAQAGGPNGILVDPQGRLVVNESGARRVTRTERDGSVTVLADNYEGKKFNSPNDLAIDSKGRIYFTDPRYGRRDTMEMTVEGVYRIDGPQKVTRIINGEVNRPNGILISPDDRHLFVADNNNNTVGGARKLLRFDLKPDGSVDLSSRRLIFDWKTGRGPDGLKMDRKGILYVAAGLNSPHPPHETTDEFKGGIYVLSPAGSLLEFIAIPKDEVTNCAFGGPDLKTLYITAGGTLWSIRTNTAGRISARR